MSITIGHFAMVGILTIANCPKDETANATLAGRKSSSVMATVVTGYSEPLMTQVRHRGFVLWRICSLQVRHGTDSLRRAVRSPSVGAPTKTGFAEIVDDDFPIVRSGSEFIAV